MGSAKWWGVTSWYIDPAQTHGGSDENDGLTSSTPIKSIAEWRRRIGGAVFAASVVIHPLSSSANPDDGIFTGFETSLSAQVVIAATPTVLFSGTVSSIQQYSGNTRASITDSTLSSTWTAADGISSTTASRFIRKTGTGARQYAPMLLDLGAKAAQVGIAANWDETDTSSLTSTETQFASNDSYQALSLLTWPIIQQASGSVRVQFCDVIGYQTTNLNAEPAGLSSYVVCGFPSGMAISFITVGRFFNCVITGPHGTSISGVVNILNCSLLNTVCQLSLNQSNLTTAIVVVASSFRLWLGSLTKVGNIRSFDCTSPCLDVEYASSAVLTGAITGTGNTAALISVANGAVVYGGVNALASTSGTAFSADASSSGTLPLVSAGGSAIYA